VAEGVKGEESHLEPEPEPIIALVANTNDDTAIRGTAHDRAAAAAAMATQSVTESVMRERRVVKRSQKN
jgi:hypothetical protein